RARLAERRVIRRELHDGVGPWLVGLRLGLQGARNTLETDPAAAAAVLDALGAEVAQRVEDVRALSRSLLPPSLDEHGLEVALGELAGLQALGGFVVDVRCDPSDGLDPRVAAAAYAIASESVVNAARHSGAGECRLTVRLGDRCVVVTCEDDGRGIATDATRGVGSRSLRERTDELGGRLEVSAVRPDGERPGTRVRATLPLVPAGALAREDAS